MSTILRSALPMAAACAIATSAFAVVTPQKITWVGEETGNLADAANWDPAKVPSANSSTKAYIAVFTNSVTVTSLDYWYSGGIEVKNGANVVFTGTGTYRFYPTTADIGGDGDGGTNIVFDVETGSTLKFNGVAFRGLETVTFVKKGGGKFINTSWIGNIYQYRNVDVREGEMELTTTDSRFNLVPRLTVRSGAVFKTKMPGGLTAAHNPSVTIDAGGLYDVGGKALNISHLSGAGTVSNVTTVTITGIGDAVETNLFSGRIYGKLSIAPTAGTPAGSAFIVGATNTLAKSDLSIDISACPTVRIRRRTAFVRVQILAVRDDVLRYGRQGGRACECVLVRRSVFRDVRRRHNCGDGVRDIGRGDVQFCASGFGRGVCAAWPV